MKFWPSEWATIDEQNFTTLNLDFLRQIWAFVLRLEDSEVKSRQTKDSKMGSDSLNSCIKELDWRLSHQMVYRLLQKKKTKKKKTYEPDLEQRD